MESNEENYADLAITTETIDDESYSTTLKIEQLPAEAEDDSEAWSGRLEDAGVVWSNRTVFMLIEQYRLFKDILDDKQHAKKPVWERIARNLVQQGISVTATQCSQKWRNMMLQRRIKRLKVLMGQSPSTRTVPQPWDDLLESVAPAIDDDVVSRMSLPQRPPVVAQPKGLSAAAKSTQHLKRKRTEEAIKRSLGWTTEADSPASFTIQMSTENSSTSGGSEHLDDQASPSSPKQVRLAVHNGYVAAPAPAAPTEPPIEERLDALTETVEQIKRDQDAFLVNQRETAEREERRLKLFEQFLGLFGQAVKMFASIDSH